MDSNSITQEAQEKKRPRGRPKGSKNKKPALAQPPKNVVNAYQNLGLQLVQAKFVAEYMTNGFSASKAYMTAVDKTCSPEKAQVQGLRLLSSDKVRSAISKAMSDYLADKREKLEVSIISTLWARAFYDPAMFMTTAGEPCFRKWDEVPRKWRCVVDGIETKALGKNDAVCTIKLANRSEAIEKLARYIGMFSADRVDHQLTLSPEAEKNLRAIFGEHS